MRKTPGGRRARVKIGAQLARALRSLCVFLEDAEYEERQNERWPEDKEECDEDRAEVDLLLRAGEKAGERKHAEQVNGQRNCSEPEHRPAHAEILVQICTVHARA